MSIPFQIDLFVIIQIATAGFCVLIALNLFNRTEVTGARRLAFLMAALGLWTFASGMESAFLTNPTKILSAKVMHIGVQSVPPLLFLFSIEYSARKYWLEKRNQVLIWILPIITILLVFTNEYHHLIWSNITLPNISGNRFLIYTHGIWFWISTLYHYALITSASIFLITGTKERKPKRQFWQISVILLALAIAWGVNLVYILGIIPIPGLDLTPIAFTITISLVYLAIYPMRFLDISPIARSKLVDTMSDAFYVFDENNNLIDINPAGLALLDKSYQDLIHSPAEQVFDRWPDLVQHIEQSNKEYGNSYVIQDTNDTWFDVRISTLSEGRKASTVWLVIMHDISQNKLAEKELQHQAAGLRTVSEISLSIATSNHPQRLLQDVVDLTAERFQFYYVQVFITEAENQVLRLAAAFGEAGKKLLKSHFYIPLSSQKSIISWAANSRQSVIVNDVTQESKYLPNPDVPGTRSEMAVPILFRDELLGVLDIQSNRTGHFNELDRHIQNTLAAQISVALMNARLFDDLNRRAREAEMLRQAGSIVASTLNQDEAIERILEQLKQVVPYDRSSVQLRRDDYLEIVGGNGFSDSDQIIGLKFHLSGASASAKILQTNSPLILNDVQEDFPDFRLPPHNHIHGWMGVPLIVQNELIGVITLDSSTPGTFDQSQARLVQAFADQVAIALKNARLFEDTRRLATMDPLTSIYNRRHFYELAHREFERSHRYHHPLSVIMFDLDLFKQVNDTYGHAAGDLVLQIVAETCRTKLRKSDIFGRYGGEEFIVVMPETDEQRAWNVAERLRRSITRTPIHINGDEISITISLGVATLSKEFLFSDMPGDMLEKLIDHADQALYQAKQAGRNRVIVHHNKPI